jgi:hypothetical protein
MFYAVEERLLLKGSLLTLEFTFLLSVFFYSIIVWKRACCMNGVQLSASVLPFSLKHFIAGMMPIQKVDGDLNCLIN